MTRSKYIAISVLFSMIVLLVPQPGRAAFNGSVQITSPSGGEVFTVGDTTTIRWTNSPNIDKVSLMLKATPSLGDWIVTNIPNTGSYSWNVKKWNTTNTQFFIHIIAYETGQGNTSDDSAVFTINSANTPTPTPTRTPTPTPIKTPTPTVNNTPNPTTSGCVSSGKGSCITTPTPTPARTTIPASTPTVDSINDVKLNDSLFYFEGSQTTRLSDIEDPEHVEDFTLDFRGVGYIEWTEEIDLSTPEAIAALQNLNKYVEYDEYYFFIYIEFWIIWEVPLEITFYDFEAVAPPTIVKDGKPIDTQAIIATPSKSPTASPKKNVTFKAESGGKYTIQHGINLESQEKTSDETYVVRGTVSDPKATVNLTLNGQSIEGPVAVDPKTGIFEKTVSLILGHNAIAATATSPTGPVTPDDLSVTYDKAGSLLWIILVIIAILAVAYFLWRRHTMVNGNYQASQ